MKAFKLCFVLALATALGCSAGSPDMGSGSGPDAGFDNTDPGSDGDSDPDRDPSDNSDPSDDPDPGEDPDEDTNPDDVPETFDVVAVSAIVLSECKPDSKDPWDWGCGDPWDLGGGAPDVKAIFTIGEEVYETDKAKNTLEPAWDEVVASDIQADALSSITVKLVDIDLSPIDASFLGTDFIGECSFDMAAQPFDGAPFELNCPLDIEADPKQAGFFITLQVAPSTGGTQ